MLLERCIRRDVGNFGRNDAKIEQHGRTSRMSMALVYCLFCHCFLVFHRRLVVPAVKALSTLPETALNYTNFYKAEL